MRGITEVFGFSQISGCFHCIGSNLPCAHPGEAAFRRTFINKLDAAGRPRLFDVVDQSTNETTFTPLLSYVEDISTGDLYLDEEWYILAIKCAAVALGNPLYALGVEFWHFTKTVLIVGVVGLDAVEKLGAQLWQGELRAVVSTCWNWFAETGSVLGEGIWEMVVTPFYAIGVEFSAIYGIFDQYRGRKWVAAIERSWKKGVSYKEGSRGAVHNENESCWDAFVRRLKTLQIHYLANCFQKRGHVWDLNIRVIRSEELFRSCLK